MRRSKYSTLFNLLFLVPLLLSCSVYIGDEPGEVPTLTPTNWTVQPDTNGSASETESDVSDFKEGGVIATRTPKPTATPGFLVESAEEITEQLGLNQQTFLGLGLDDWLVLFFGALVAIGVYLLATWLVKGIFPNLARRTQTQFDDRLLEISGKEIQWLVLVLTLQLVTPRLVFLSAEFKSLLTDLYFVITMVLILRITWHGIDYIEKHAHHRLVEQGREVEMAPVLKLVVISGQAVVIIFLGSILLSHFGIEVGGLVAAMGLGGLALSLAARDTIADAIAGLIILIDRPFRVGDRIEILGLGTWGDVTTIGLRSTSILTRDNRMVILPNSMISNNEIVNYSYPNPEYRIQTHISIAYGTPIKTIQELVLNTMKAVDGVMQDRDIDVLYHEMGSSAMIFRVRWWINTYANKRCVIDRVHIALQEAIDGAGLVSPFNIQTIDLQINPDTARLIKGLSSDVDRGNMDD